MTSIRWGIIGPGNIAHKFADGLKESKSGELVAIASTNEGRRKSFGDKYNIDSTLRFSSYDELVESSILTLFISLPLTHCMRNGRSKLQVGENMYYVKNRGRLILKKANKSYKQYKKQVFFIWKASCIGVTRK